MDLVVADGGKLIPIEIKLSSTPSTAMARGIEAFRRYHPAQSGQGWVVHPGNLELPLGAGAQAIPFSGLW